MAKTSFNERNEHSFAPFIRILGKGKRGSRSLGRQEAFDAMTQILAGQVLDVQLGAFLMLLRIKEETPEEIAGFVEAAQVEFDQRTNGAFRSLNVDLDWSSYAGKRRHLPWFLLAIRALAGSGYRVFVHGAAGHTHGRLYTQDIAERLGIPLATDAAGARAALDRQNCVFMPLKLLWPSLENIIQMRSLLGLRSPVHSMARLLNPTRAPAVLQGVFHPPYLLTHQQAALALGYESTLVIKGEGGEIERNPDAAVAAHWALSGSGTESGEQEHGIIELPALFERRHIKPEALDPSLLSAVWRDEISDEYGEAAVISTIELGLRAMSGACARQTDHAAEAAGIWEQRNRALIQPDEETKPSCPLATLD